MTTAPTKLRAYPARLIDRDGFAYRATVEKPFPEALQRSCARHTEIRIERVHFRFVGVETDASGSPWARYEEDR